MSEHAPPPSSPRPSTAAPEAVHDDLVIIEDDQQVESERDTATATREGAADVAREARRQSRMFLDEARHQLRDQADQQTGQMSQALQRLGANLDALADGRPQEAGELSERLRDLGSRTREMADRIEELGVDGVTREVQRFARQRPGAFLLAAVAAGFAAGRLGRSVAAADDEQDTGMAAASPRPRGAMPEPTREPGLGTEPAAPVVETAGIPVPPAPDPTRVPPPGSGEVRR